jgi:hypothetical protein
MGRRTKSEIALHQREDPVIFQAIKCVENGKRPTREEIPGANPIHGSWWSQFDRLKSKDGLQFRRRTSRTSTTVCTPENGQWHPGASTRYTNCRTSGNTEDNRESCSAFLLEGVETRCSRLRSKLQNLWRTKCTS